MLRQICVATGLLSLLASSCADVDEAFATNLVQRKARTHVASPAALSRKCPSQTRPWHVHKYLAATYHKSGVYLMYDLWTHYIFPALGAQESDMGKNSIPCYPVCDPQNVCFNTCHGLDRPIQTWIDMFSSEMAEHFRQGAGAQGVRIAAIVRDPLMMVASAYCYHHRGEETLNANFLPDVAGTNGTSSDVTDVKFLTDMDPLEGTAYVAEKMLRMMENMTSVFAEPLASDTHRVSFEQITNSSEGFDDEVTKLVDFLFADVNITTEERRDVLEAAKQAGLHRHPDHEDIAGHSNDAQCEAEAKQAVLAMPEHLLTAYRSFQQRFGYPAW